MKTHREVILDELSKTFKTQSELDSFLSTPNKLFHYRSPGDCLNGADYSIFYDIFEREQTKLDYL